jgi:hypothetical protein
MHTEGEHGRLTVRRRFVTTSALVVYPSTRRTTPEGLWRGFGGDERSNRRSAEEMRPFVVQGGRYRDPPKLLTAALLCCATSQRLKVSRSVVR